MLTVLSLCVHIIGSEDLCIKNEVAKLVIYFSVLSFVHLILYMHCSTSGFYSISSSKSHLLR